MRHMNGCCGRQLEKEEKEVWTVEGILPLRRCDAGDGQQVIGFVQFFWRPSADSYPPPPFLCSLVYCAGPKKKKKKTTRLIYCRVYLVAAIERVSRRPQQSRDRPPIKGLATSAKRGENVRDHVAFFSFLSFFYFAFLPLPNTRH